MGKDGVPNRFVEDHDRAQSDTKPGRQCDTAPTLGEVSESEDDGDDASLTFRAAAAAPPFVVRAAGMRISDGGLLGVVNADIGERAATAASHSR